MKVLLDLIDSIWELLMLINVLLYLYSAYSIKNLRSLNILTVYLALICANQLVSSYLSSIGENNLFLFHVYLTIQFVCLSFFYKSLFTSKQKSVVNLLLVVVLITLLAYYLIWPEDFAYFNLPEILIATIPVLAYIMMHLYNSLSNKGDYLYFSGGLLVYLSISSLVFLLYALLVDDVDNKILSKETSNNIANINVVSYLLLQIVIFIEWKINISKWKAKKV